MKKVCSFVLLCLMIICFSACLNDYEKTPVKTEAKEDITELSTNIKKDNQIYSERNRYNISENFTWDDFCKYCDNEKITIKKYWFYFEEYFYGDDFSQFKKSTHRNSDYVYSVYENGGILIDYCLNMEADVVIPDEIDGYKVIGIGRNAIKGENKSFNNVIKSLTLGENIVYLADNSCNDCHNLKSVFFPDTMILISGGAFRSCYKLANIKLPNKLQEIGNAAFYNCTKLESVIVPESVICIGNLAFAECYSLKSIKLPDNIEVIEDKTFYMSQNLSEINTPSCLKTVENEAFDGTKIDTSIFENAGVEVRG